MARPRCHGATRSRGATGPESDVPEPGWRVVGAFVAEHKGREVFMSHPAARSLLIIALPVALIGLGELKQRGRGWFRSGEIEVRVGEPLRFGPLETEAGITERLHAAVSALMAGQR